MQTITSANATATANSMAPARCVFDMRDDQPPVQGIMPPVRAEALMMLTSARLDTHTLKRAENYHCFKASHGESGTGALKRAATSLSFLAQSFRRARWAEAPTPRLGERFFPQGANGDDTTTLSILGELARANNAVNLRNGSGSPVTFSHLQGLLKLAHRYPSVSPREEARLAAQGYTGAELLATMACRAAVAIAELYLAGDETAAAHHTAKDALHTAQDAAEVIEAGVAHTLGP